jgi:hypothetical protein
MSLIINNLQSWTPLPPPSTEPLEEVRGLRIHNEAIEDPLKEDEQTLANYVLGNNRAIFMANI